eukprot:CAMPEP_0181124182 /NCGR_PEP_ID=MMETSP1071-20121207/26330_1 /TAXON_ID=35127 /ORGANISM="Thalassiosira sp., Strain NH16" /LENGTH=354 /DNA_ID=CAMNT_0023209441 /DNA_START=61 /DNA_END=1125 /DNA_ORIENTATION=-
MANRNRKASQRMRSPFTLLLILFSLQHASSSEFTRHASSSKSNSLRVAAATNAAADADASLAASSYYWQHRRGLSNWFSDKYDEWSCSRKKKKEEKKKNSKAGKESGGSSSSGSANSDGSSGGASSTSESDGSSSTSDSDGTSGGSSSTGSSGGNSDGLSSSGSSGGDSNSDASANDEYASDNESGGSSNSTDAAASVQSGEESYISTQVLTNNDSNGGSLKGAYVWLFMLALFAGVAVGIVVMAGKRRLKKQRIQQQGGTTTAKNSLRETFDVKRAPTIKTTFCGGQEFYCMSEMVPDDVTITSFSERETGEVDIGTPAIVQMTAISTSKSFDYGGGYEAPEERVHTNILYNA